MSKQFTFGEGKLAGYISVFLGALAFLAVFCFKYPRILTSPELREIYTGEQMRVLLTATIIASLFFAVLSFLQIPFQIDPPYRFKLTPHSGKLTPVVF